MRLLRALAGLVFLAACTRDPLGSGPSPDGGAAPDLISPAAYRERVVRACVIAASCTPDPTRDDWFDVAAGRCIEDFANVGLPSGFAFSGPTRALADRLLQCSEMAGSNCAALHDCFGGTWIGLKMCREGGTCDGNRLVKWQTMLSLDCARIGATCVDLPTGAIRACCTPSSCGQAQTLTCAGPTATLCALGVPVTLDCASQGLTCGTMPSAPCVGTGAACDPSERVSCAGTVATYCAHQRRATVDCANNPLRSRCNQDQPSFAPCRPAGDACSGFESIDACDGDSLVVCVNGNRQKVDCRALGWTGCAAAGEFARCIR